MAGEPHLDIDIDFSSRVAKAASRAFARKRESHLEGVVRFHSGGRNCGLPIYFGSREEADIAILHILPITKNFHFAPDFPRGV